MRKLFLIGIGAGDPEQLTVQAIKALNQVDVFFVVDKGPDAADLTTLRREICERYIEHPSYRFVEVLDPRRDRAAPGYRQAVEEWRRQRTEIYERLVRDELGEDSCGAFLVWGDPSLYDGTLQIVEQIAGRGDVRFDYEVVPGISSVQVLAARHRVPLNRVGRPVQITTGRLLADGFPEGSDDVVVMLDGGASFRKVPAEGVEIYWGAYLGTEDEILVSGHLADVADEIEATRQAAKTRKGWIMDTYLLRRTPGR
jgi:precorrin-6A synthase